MATRELSRNPALLKKGGETADGVSEYLARASDQINKGAVSSLLKDTMTILIHYFQCHGDHLTPKFHPYFMSSKILASVCIHI